MREPAGSGSPAPVLARQPAARERAEGRVAEAVLAADRKHRLAVALVEEREAVLHPLVARQALELGQLERLGQLLAGEVRRADRADLARSARARRRPPASPPAASPGRRRARGRARRARRRGGAGSSRAGGGSGRARDRGRRPPPSGCRSSSRSRSGRGRPRPSSRATRRSRSRYGRRRTRRPCRRS